jgi:membrane fusion protein (multidrug efflux system)
MVDATHSAEAELLKGAHAKARRGLILKSFFALLLLLGLAVTAYAVLIGQFSETTDDAYVAGNLVQVSSDVAGTVNAITVDDTDRVERDQLLINLSQSSTRIVLLQAEAALASAVREARALYASTNALKNILDARQSELKRARDDVARREPLVGTGAMSAEEMQHARAALMVAIAAEATARHQWAANRAATEGTELATHPMVSVAAARVRTAYLDFAHDSIRAPVKGFVARRTVQIGQHVQRGTVLLTLVPLDDVWVDANFKESQLRNVRIGQPVTLETDLYGHSVQLKGHVQGLAAGTGSVFSLLPAQNASGNWIKVVQRLPVRIALEAADLRQHPLRVGLSARVSVDTHDRSGPVLAASERRPEAALSAQSDPDLALADEQIASIIAANSGDDSAHVKLPRVKAP